MSSGLVKFLNPMTSPLAGNVFGGSTIGKVLNPGTALEGPVAFAGKNSALAKYSEYDPLLGSAAGKYLNPAAYDAGQQRKAYFAANTGQAGPYAGVTPSIPAATAGYPTTAPSASPAAEPASADPTSSSVRPSVWTQALRQQPRQPQFGGTF